MPTKDAWRRRCCASVHLSAMSTRTRKNIRRSEQRQAANQIIASASPDTIEAARVYLREQEALASDRPASTKPRPKRNHEIAAKKRLGKAIVTIQNMKNSDANATAIENPQPPYTAPPAVDLPENSNRVHVDLPNRELFPSEECVGSRSTGASLKRTGDPMDGDGGTATKNSKIAAEGGAGAGGSTATGSTTSPSSSSSDNSGDDLPDDVYVEAQDLIEADNPAVAAEEKRVAALKAKLKEVEKRVAADNATFKKECTMLKANIETLVMQREEEEAKRKTLEAQLIEIERLAERYQSEGDEATKQKEA
jgi:hypothetical protein